MFSQCLQGTVCSSCLNSSHVFSGQLTSLSMYIKYSFLQTPKRKDAHFRRSPLIQGGLEIPVEATVRMQAPTKNVEAIERFKQLVEQQYNEPVNGQYEDCTKLKCYLEWRRKAVVMKRIRTLRQNSSK